MSTERIRINDRVVLRPLEGTGGVLLDLDSGEYRQLNSMGATIWSLLEKAPSRAELLGTLRARIKNPPEHMEKEVERFLTALQERRLIGVDSEPDSRDG
jgi:hypothetical protein